jgi:hypothetical protein
VDNGGTIILPTGGDGSAAWRRQYSGAVNVLWFRAHPSATPAANQAAIEQAIATASGGNDVLFPPGVYEVSGEIVVPDHVRLVGFGAAYEDSAQVFYGSWLKLKDSSGLTANQGVIRFKYDNTFADQRHMGGAYRLGVFGNKSNNTNGNGFIVEGVRYVALVECASVRNKNDGIKVITDTGNATSANDIYLHRNNLLFNDGDGIEIAAGDSTLIANIAGQNGAAGINLNGGGSHGVIGNQSWFNTDGIVVAATAVEMTLTGNQVYDNQRSGILLSSGASKINVTGNTIWDNGQDPSAIYSATDEAGILISGASTNVNISGNHSYDTGAGTQKYGISVKDAGATVGLAGNYGTGNATAFYNITAGASFRLSDDVGTNSSGRHAGFTLDGSINANEQTLSALSGISGGVELTVSTVSSGVLAATNKSWIAANVAGGATVTDITTTLAGRPIIVLRNLNASALVFQHNVSKLRNLGGTDKTINQHETIMYQLVSGVVWAQIAGKQ